MRLIDADKLILHLNDFMLQQSPIDVQDIESINVSAVIKDCIKAVEEQPTAYDVDKVVEQFTMIDYAIGDEEETEENVMNAKTYIEGLGITGQLLILIADELEDAYSYIINYKSEYDEKNGKRIMEVCRFLEQFGLKLKEEEYQVLEGTHKMFGKVKWWA